MAKRDYSERFAHHLRTASGAIKADRAAMLARHSAAGQLMSGDTVRSATTYWDRRTGEAVDTALAEFSPLIETRGSEWHRAMGAILDGLEGHRASAFAVLDDDLPPGIFKGPRGDSTAAAAEKKLDEAVDRLKERVSAYRQGWTSPRARRWNERHPVAYALILALIGALLAVGVRAIGDATTSEKVRSSHSPGDHAACEPDENGCFLTI